jgi:rhamnulokinase
MADIYAQTLKKIEEVSGRSIQELYIIGGGCQNNLLCQLTADLARIQVYAGPVEATAIGNLMIQSLSKGQINSIREGRKIIRKSYKIKSFYPEKR